MIDTELHRIATLLLRGLPAGLSSFAEDMPKGTPFGVLKQLESAEDFYKRLGVELMELAKDVMHDC